MKNSTKLFAFLLMSYWLVGCEKMFMEEPANNPEAIFENLWTTFQEDYAPFAERNVDWQQEYSHFRNRVSQNTTEAQLFGILSEMLGTLDDGHVSLTAPGRDIFYSNRIRNELIDDELFSLPIVKTYLEEDFKMGKDNSYIYGKIKNENIAYIFFDHVGENFFKLQDFLNEYSAVNGFIIDLRHNQGGDFTYCFSEIGRLAKQSHYVFRSKTKNGKGPNDYTDWYEWHIHPKGEYINKPIAVLTDRYTISAGERSVMAFNALPNTTVIGEITNGAHGTMIGKELANGWYYSLVPQLVEMPDGNSYEGIGLAPDIYIKNTVAEMGLGIDKTLETAVEELK